MMQIPVENLSQILPVQRTDYGMDVRQRAGPNAGDGSQYDKFVKALEEAAKKAGPSAQGGKRPGSAGFRAQDKPGIAGYRASDKQGKFITADDETITGVMGTQNTVVSILEGDKDSVTTPDFLINIDIPVFDEELPEAGASAGALTEIPEAPETPEAPEAPGQAQSFAGALEAAVEEHAGTVVTELKPERNAEQTVATGPLYVEEKVTAGQADNKKAVDIVGDNKIETGELAARTPEIGISEQSDMENENDENREFSGSGSLSPLENENDAAPAKERKVKSYSEAEEAVRNTAGTTEQQTPADAIPPPLSAGIKPEQFQATQQMSRTLYEAPVRAENLFDEMVSRIDTMVTESRSSMSIQLKPEFMGKVELEIALDAAGLHVKINAANQEVRAAVSGQITALIESLGNKGIEVVEVEVAYTGFDNSNLNDSRGEQASSGGSKKTRNTVRNTDETAYYAAAIPLETLEHYLDASVSSVEYRA